MRGRKRNEIFRDNFNHIPEKNISTGWSIKGFLYFIIIFIGIGVIKFLFF